VVAQLILSVWREVGRHLDLPELMERLFPRLSQELPLSALLVRHVDLAAGCVETLASGIPVGAIDTPRARADLASDHLQSVLRWCRAATATYGRAAADAAGVSLLAPDNLPPGEVVLLPLPPDDRDEHSPAGALVGLIPERARLTASHRQLLESLAEPFTAALANDCRIRELRVLREAVEAENRALLTRLGRPRVGDVVVGAEAGLKAVLERVELVARSDAPVLILGETGTGKEVIARAIHSRSARSSGPLIRVNCGAIPPELVDSELFGHERGSFTGATATRKGWFERADGGTLFLDEIGELPLAAQVRLLRILQDGTFERVGGQNQLTAHVRLVAATHRDLLAMVGEGRFREDLWYRICVFPIHLPPLRERTHDIPELATHFALRAARRLGLAAALPTPSDLALLTAYPWPGNVRELMSVIERAAILGEGRQLELAKALGGPTAAVPPSARQAPEIEALSAVAPGRPQIAAPADQTLEGAMVRHIEAALTASLGRIEGPFGAARRLQINPHTLRARMRRLGIDWKRYRQPEL
jgi:transcriptional regulator with GAF, ATPase, and Fis domain